MYSLRIDSRMNGEFVALTRFGMTTYIRELIHIPERVHQGDFVLKLTEGVKAAEATLADYVVTPELERCFDDALNFIQSAVQSGSSKAAYLHGSFGSGKSHFMAVLTLLLAGNTKARSIRELATVVAKHNAWTEGKRFLLVPYHMIGARNMESAILGGYADHVRQLHPDAPIPGFYLAEGLFRDAQSVRERMGDAAFFDKLNEGQDSNGDGWGDLSGGWNAGSFESALLESPRGEERMRLVGDLIGKFFTSYASLAEAQGEAFLQLDDGLSILSRHAKEIGYDGVILFLDELILWLASQAANLSFVSSEGVKLVKLVEAGNADRPIPLVSFIARQRDLRELVGDNLAGAVGIQIGDVLKYWEARFHRITLEDRNLPVIARHRLLKPVSETARQELEQAFENFANGSRMVLDTLLTAKAGPEMFRMVYPFSPALVETLIAVSSVLQRERTALKLMLQLLVDRRGELELGQIIPVGDLYDVIAEGDEPFSDAMRLHFDNAKRLYNQKLLPLLERTHGIGWADVRHQTADPVKARALRNDARLLKTLLLSALVPEVETLKNLTPARLAALNHGSVVSPLPGREAQGALKKCRDWAAEVGEIKIVDEQNPVISIQVTGIDIEPILAGAAMHDNPGNRRRKIRELLFAELGIPDSNELFVHFDFTWRGTPREVEILYENVRELTDDRLRGREGGWTAILDFPFDEPNRTPADDIARLDRYEGPSTHTLIWLPSFFSEKSLNDLKRLVILDYILTADRFNDYAAHLSQVDRVQAKSLARNQRDQLHQRLKQALEVAYGITSEPRDAIAHPLTAQDKFRTLDRTLQPQPPVGANPREAFINLLEQVLAHEYPAHPQFETDIKPATLRKVEAELARALQEKDHRVFVADKAARQLTRALVNPLRLGNMGETHLVLELHWRRHFLQKMAEAGIDGDALTVAQLRRWIDEPRPMGLPTEVQNLIIHTFAAQTNRSFYLNKGPYQPTLENTPNELVLKEQALPRETVWRTALKRASLFFGLTLAESLNAANVAKLAEQLGAEVKNRFPSLQAYAQSLAEHWQTFGTPDTESSRLKTARGTVGLLAAMSVPNADLIEVLAESPIETNETAYGQTIGKAEILKEALQTADWDLFAAACALRDERRKAAQLMRERIIEVLGTDEHAIALKPALAEQKAKALKLLTEAPPQPPPPPPPLPPPTPIPGVKVVWQAEKNDLSPKDARETLDKIAADIEQDADYRLSISWKITKPLTPTPLPSGERGSLHDRTATGKPTPTPLPSEERGSRPAEPSHALAGQGLHAAGQGFSKNEDEPSLSPEGRGAGGEGLP